MGFWEQTPHDGSVNPESRFRMPAGAQVDHGSSVQPKGTCAERAYRNMLRYAHLGCFILLIIVV